MNIILDNIAIWQPKLEDGFTSRMTPAGAKIQKPGTKIITRSEAPIFRYAKNYKTKGRGGVRFCLFVRTYLDDGEKVEKALDAYAEGMSTEKASKAVAEASVKNFTYTNDYLEVE